MAKAIFFNIPSTGHVNPAQAVIAELVRRGEHVIYYNTEDTRAQIEQTGAEFRPYPRNPTLLRLNEQASGGNLADNALALVGIAEQLMPAVLDALRQEKPDYVIHDSLAGWGKQAAEALNIPSVSSIVTFAVNPQVTMQIMPPLLMLRMFADITVRMPAYLRIAGRMRRVYGVKGVGLPNALMCTGALNIVYTSREFQPSGETFDDSFKFVGPSITERADTSGFPFDQIGGGRLVLISLGTINNQNLDFYRACFHAFADFPAQFVLSAGKQTDLNMLDTVPANFIVRHFVPQLDILKRADLFITHGGMNSVSESLWYGVPMVAVPQQAEQGLVAREVMKHGAGLALGLEAAGPAGTASAGDLRAAVERVLGAESFRQAAKRLGDGLRAAGGYQRAADEIMAFGRRA